MPASAGSKKADQMTADTEHICQELSERLKSFILRRVRSEHDAFGKIHANAGSLKQQDKLESWLYQITRHTITDYYRRRSNAPLDIADMPEPEANDEGPDEYLEDLTACLKPMIDSLPEKYRLAIVATEYEGLSHKALSQQLGMSLSGAKSRVQRGGERLKGTLLGCCHFEFDWLGKVINYQPKEPGCRYCPGEESGPEYVFSAVLRPFCRDSVYQVWKLRVSERNRPNYGGSA